MIESTSQLWTDEKISRRVGTDQNVDLKRTLAVQGHFVLFV